MILPDINLLVYAYNTGAPHHREAKIWWEGVMNGSVPVAMPWLISSGFIRLVTHPRILQYPMRADEAVAHVQEWLEQPGVAVLEPGQRFSGLFLGYLSKLGTAGNLTTDAQLAALAVEHQCELHSNDADFSRFSGLNWRNPLA